MVPMSTVRTAIPEPCINKPETPTLSARSMLTCPSAVACTQAVELQSTHSPGSLGYRFESWTQLGMSCIVGPTFFSNIKHGPQALVWRIWFLAPDMSKFRTFKTRKTQDLKPRAPKRSAFDTPPCTLKRTHWVFEFRVEATVT